VPLAMNRLPGAKRLCGLEEETIQEQIGAQRRAGREVPAATGECGAYPIPA